MVLVKNGQLLHVFIICKTGEENAFHNIVES